MIHRMARVARYIEQWVYRTDAERSSGLIRKDQTALALEGLADSQAFVEAA